MRSRWLRLLEELEQLGLGVLLREARRRSV